MALDDKDEGFEWAVGLNRRSLDLIGVWPRASDVAIVAPTLAVFMFLGITFPQLHALARVYRRLPLVVDNLTTCCGSVVAITKIVVLWTGRGEIAKLVGQVRRDWLADKTAWELGSMRRQASRGRLLTIAGYCTTLGCIAGFTAMPIFKLSIRELNNITDLHPQRYLPFQALYLYDAYASPVYELTYLHQMLAGCLMGMSFSVPENFFGVLVFHACAQCEMLQVRFESLANSALELDSNFVARLRRAVRRHVRLVRFVNEVEALFHLLILAHMLFLVVIIGFLGFTLLEALGKDTKSPPLVQVVTLSATAVDILLHTLIYCGTGEMLTANSSRLLEATYLPSLHSMPISRARDLVMIMMRSQLPLRLSAGKILYLSLNTYLQLVKNTVGYISMLITVNQ